MEADSFVKMLQVTGPSVAICLMMLLAFGKYIVKLDERADIRNKEHREERKEDREAHVAALKEISAKLHENTEKVGEATTVLSNIERDLRRQV